MNGIPFIYPPRLAPRELQGSTHHELRRAITMAAAEKPLSTGVIFGTSGLGGIAGWMWVHPFNTLAVRMNLATMGANAGPRGSFPQFASKLIKTEGFASLYHMSAFTELRARNNAGDEVSFDAFAGKVVLVVNVARL